MGSPVSHPFVTPVSPSTPARATNPSTQFTGLSDAHSESSTAPHALRAFLMSLAVKRDYLEEMFVAREFDTEETLDLLCQSWREPEFELFMQEIRKKSFAASLAVKKGLRARESALRAKDDVEMANSS